MPGSLFMRFTKASRRASEPSALEEFLLIVTSGLAISLPVAALWSAVARDSLEAVIAGTVTAADVTKALVFATVIMAFASGLALLIAAAYSHFVPARSGEGVWNDLLSTRDADYDAYVSVTTLTDETIAGWVERFDPTSNSAPRFMALRRPTMVGASGGEVGLKKVSRVLVPESIVKAIAVSYYDKTDGHYRKDLS